MTLEPKPQAEGVARPQDFAHWLTTRPPVIKKLVEEFPMGTVIVDRKKREWYVIGWGEPDHLIISPIWPGDDYEAAMAQRRNAHAHHARNLEDGTIVKRYQPA